MVSCETHPCEKLAVTIEILLVYESALEDCHVNFLKFGWMIWHVDETLKSKT